MLSTDKPKIKRKKWQPKNGRLYNSYFLLFTDTTMKWRQYNDHYLEGL